jgi:Flp pilus assembly protein TadG
MARMNTRARWSSSRGSESVEMAVVLPLLLGVMLGIIEFGFLFQRYVVLTNAAVEGARIAGLPGYAAADAEARVRDYALNSGIPDAATSVVPVVAPVDLPGAGGGTWPGMQVTVTHVYNYTFLRPAVRLLLGQNWTSITLTTRSTMRSQVAAAGS